jgi:hypothetical protein
MNEYQCSSCGTTYSFHEYNQLDQVQAVKDEDNPTAPTGHGYHKVCDCGHEFHKDDWNEVNTVEATDREFRISTTHLVLNHGHGERDLWYETCVFWDGGSYVVDRYKTQEEPKTAMNGSSRRLKTVRLKCKTIRLAR